MSTSGVTELNEKEIMDTCRFIVISEITIQLNNWIKDKPNIVGTVCSTQVGRAVEDITDRELMAVLMTNSNETMDCLWFSVSRMEHESGQFVPTDLSETVQAYNQVYSNLLKLEALVDSKDKEHITTALSNISLVGERLKPKLL